jgi:glycosyltransferase involved in cell wall biosynthesis
VAVTAPTDRFSNNIAQLLQGQSLNIVCLSDAPWDWIPWTNRQYALSTLASLHKGTRVLYVETPSFVMWRKMKHRESWPSGAPIVRHHSSMPFCQEVQERIWVLHPPLPVPFRTARKVAFSLLQWETLLLTRKALRRLGFGPVLFWVYNPYGGWYVNRLDERYRVYECLNEHSVSLFYSWDKERIIRLEERLMRTVDVVFTVSPSLQERKKVFNPNTFMVGNPANYELFSQCQERKGVRPKELAHLSGPILGFYGALSGFKIDIQLLCQLAEAHPQWNIVLIGPMHDGDWKKLSAYSNVLILGAMPQAELARYVTWFDVLLIPYRLNDYILDSAEPLKMNEYFSTGKPIVSTDIPGHRVYNNLIYLANGFQSFSTYVQQALDDNGLEKRKRRIEIARERTWQHKVHAMLSTMVECGLLWKLGENP